MAAEVLALSIGTTVAKWVVRLWTGSSDAADASSDLAALFAPWTQDYFEKRRAARIFENVAEEVAQRVMPFIASESRELDEGEVTAATLAADRALSSIYSLAAIVNLNLRADELSRQAKESDATASEADGLSEAGRHLYSLLIEEGATCVIALATKLPTFSTVVFKELLARESNIYFTVQQILRQLPPSRVPQSWGSGTEFERFSDRYMQAIYEFADRLQLFGITNPAARSAYSLSVAYVPLNATTTAVHEKGTGPTRDPLGDESEAGASRVSRALQGNPRVLLTGGAGSGKTTLLQWLAVTAARHNFREDLEDWNGRVPFLVQFRRYAGQGLPSTSADYLRYTTPSLIDSVPDGWITTLLQQERALLLLDGFDEIDPDERQTAVDWINDLSRTFPRTVFIVTSRDAAVEQSWPTREKFKRVALEEMDYTDVRAFVQHWHRAAGEIEPTAEVLALLEGAERAAIRAIRSNRAIKSLCSTPLLCALICAVNRDSGSKLPESRIELYNTALDMLLVRRDRSRHVALGQEMELTFAELLILLQSFAYWMQENQLSDTSYEQFKARITHEMKRLHRVRELDAGALARHILERCGVLREPVSGRVDFVHKTFLEYLAAAQMVQEDFIAKLVANAEDDHWREVIIIAAGLAAPKARAELLNGIIDRGRDEPQNLHVLYLLALSCMETAPELNEDLQQKLKNCLRSVLPPHSMTDASSVASAGQLAVPLLRVPPRYALDAGACVRALALIGGEDALDALRAYRLDRRLTVSRQIFRAWGYFDATQFAESVLADAPLDRGSLVVSDPEHIANLHLLSRLRSVVVDVRGRLDSFSTLPRISGAMRVTADNSSQLTNLDHSEGLDCVTGLSVMRCSNLVDVSGVRNLHALESFDIEGSRSVDHLPDLSELSHLRVLDVSSTSLRRLIQARLPQLDRFRIHDCKLLSELEGAVRARHVQLTACPQLEELRDFLQGDDLTSLIIWQLPEISEEIRLGTELKTLSVEAGLLAQVVGATSLERLSLTGKAPLDVLEKFVGERPVRVVNTDLQQLNDIVDLLELLEPGEVSQVTFAGRGREAELPLSVRALVRQERLPGIRYVRK